MTSISSLIGYDLNININDLHLNVFCTGFNMEKQIYIGTNNDNNENVIFSLKHISKITNIGKKTIQHPLLIFGEEYASINPYKWVSMSFNRNYYENTLIETFQKENEKVI
jgi:hypothetical protein